MLLTFVQVKLPLRLSLEQLYNGETLELQYIRQVHISSWM